MSMTWKEWEEHFDSLDTKDREALFNALNELEKDSAIKEHFSWTGLFAFKYIIAHSEYRKTGSILSQGGQE